MHDLGDDELIGLVTDNNIERLLCQESSHEQHMAQPSALGPERVAEQTQSAISRDALGDVRVASIGANISMQVFTCTTQNRRGRLRGQPNDLDIGFAGTELPRDQRGPS